MEISQCRPSLLGGELPINGTVSLIALPFQRLDPPVQGLQVPNGRERQPRSKTLLSLSALLSQLIYWF
jgi:hypothetical protein